MRRVLFVDDEPRMLDGLRGLLHKHRHEWDMVFALGGEAALEACRQAPFDLVVSDMRMPRMSGAELLAEIQRLYPDTIRVILSGHTESEAAMRAVPVAHQFLSKPCDARALRVVIERSCGLRDLLADERLRRVVGGLGALPPRPRTALRLRELLGKPTCDTASIVQVIEGDVATAAKLLQLVNSAFFGLPRPIVSLEEAVNHLGHRTLSELVLTASVFGHARQVEPALLDALQQHALRCAAIARALAAECRDVPREDAFAAGLLHDVGVLVFAARLPGPFARLVLALRGTTRTLPDAEREVFGATHAEMGAYLLGAWGMPTSLTEAVAFHAGAAPVTAGGLDLVAITSLADRLAQELETDACGVPGARSLPIDAAFAQALGVTDRLEQWREMARAVVSDAAEAA